jgi:hypothetical protein
MLKLLKLLRSDSVGNTFQGVLARCLCMSVFGTSVPDPDSIRSVNPDSNSGSRTAKMTHKKNEKVRKFHVLKC